jgi:hypothetical protein
MLIGLDFDNTLINYDRVFLLAAQERNLVGPEFTGSKRAVRDAIRLLPDGEVTWQRLQGYVYGEGISGAELFPGVREFLLRCRTRDMMVVIVSHKTRYGHYDPARVDLRCAALGWMEAQGLFQSGSTGIGPDQVFFADSRAQKLARISALGCTHFVDDLEEVFADPEFPPGITKVLFSAEASPYSDFRCRTWAEIAATVLRHDND